MDSIIHNRNRIIFVILRSYIISMVPSCPSDNDFFALGDYGILCYIGAYSSKYSPTGQ